MLLDCLRGFFTCLLKQSFKVGSVRKKNTIFVSFNSVIIPHFACYKLFKVFHNKSFSINLKYEISFVETVLYISRLPTNEALWL